MTDRVSLLSESWDAQAQDWINWARTSHDSYSRFHRDVFLPLIPPPGRLTVDIGCGEGRVARDLQTRGHRVIGVDSSLVMSRAAASHRQPVLALAADATRLPLADGSADCVIAFMSLHVMDHMPDAVKEIARILVPGGHLGIAIVHPTYSGGEFSGDNADTDRPFIIEKSYFTPERRIRTDTRDNLTMTFHREHRPLEDYTNALARSGFLIKRLLEPTDPGQPWCRIPMFLDILAALPEARGTLPGGGGT